MNKKTKLLIIILFSIFLCRTTSEEIKENEESFEYYTPHCGIAGDMKDGVAQIFIVPDYPKEVYIFYFHEKSIGTHTYVLKEVEEEKIISTEFLLSYVLPLFAFDFTKWDQVILFLIFYITMSFLCIRHNHFSVNIVLEFLHYRFYNCVIENDDKIRIDTKIISKNR